MHYKYGEFGSCAKSFTLGFGIGEKLFLDILFEL